MRVSWGERLVGSRARLPSIDGSQNGLSSLRYFGLPPTQPLHLTLIDPTDRYLRAWKPVPSCPQFDQQPVLSRLFSLLPPPSPPSWRNEKPRLRSWKLEPNPKNGKLLSDFSGGKEDAVLLELSRRTGRPAS